MYKTIYDKINKINLEDSFKIYNDLNIDDEISISYFEDIDGYKIRKIQEVIISLARRVSELEHEWS